MITTTTEEVHQWKRRALHALDQARAAAEKEAERPTPRGAVTTFDALQAAVAYIGPELGGDLFLQQWIGPLLQLQADLLNAMSPEDRAAARTHLCTYGLYLDDLCQDEPEDLDPDGDKYKARANLAWRRQQAVLLLHDYPHLTPDKAIWYATQINCGLKGNSYDPGKVLGDILSTLALYIKDEQAWAELIRWRSRIFLKTYAQVQAYFSPVLFDGDPLLAPLVADLAYRGLMEVERREPYPGTFLAERYDQWKEWNARH